MHNHDEDYDLEILQVAHAIIADTIGDDTDTDTDHRCTGCGLRLMRAEVRHGRCGPCGQDVAVVAARRVIAASASAWRKEGLA